MNFDILDQKGNKVGQVALNATIFGADSNDALVAQSIRVRLHNAKAGTADAKSRAEVRGGGKKPWRQKGTGRARQGSIRAPQWRGGGVVHGPIAGKTTLSMPQQMRRAALFAALSDKVRAEGVVVLDGLELKEAKTSQMKEVLMGVPHGRTVLLVVPGRMEMVEQSARNLAEVKIMQAAVLHPYEILKYSTVIFLKDSLAVVESTFLASGKRQVEPSEAEPKANIAKKTTAKKTVEKPVKKVAAAKDQAKETEAGEEK